MLSAGGITSRILINVHSVSVKIYSMSFQDEANNINSNYDNSYSILCLSNKCFISALDGNVDENEAPSASDEEPEPLSPRLRQPVQPLQPLQPANNEDTDDSAADRSPSRSPSPRPRLRRRQISRSSRKLRKTRR